MQRDPLDGEWIEPPDQLEPSNGYKSPYQDLTWVARIIIILILSFKIYRIDYRAFFIPMLRERHLTAPMYLPCLFYVGMIVFNMFRCWQELSRKSPIQVDEWFAEWHSYICIALGMLLFNGIFQDLGPVLLMLPALFYISQKEFEYVARKPV